VAREKILSRAHRISRQGANRIAEIPSLFGIVQTMTRKEARFRLRRHGFAGAETHAGREFR